MLDFLNIDDYIDGINNLPEIADAEEAWREYSEDEKKAHERKKNDYNKTARSSYILQDYLLVTVDNTLKQSAKERALFRAIAEYADRNVDILSSPYFTKNMMFTEKDENVVFNLFGVDKADLAKKIKLIPKPPTNTGAVNVTPFRVLMLFVIGHYARTNEMKKMQYAYQYYAYSQYPTLFYSVGFRNGVLVPDAMEYAVDNMEMKFHLKKYGSVGACMSHAMQKAVENFLKADEKDKPDFRDLNDYAILQLAMALKSRQAAWMKKVYAEYKRVLDSGNYTSSYDDERDDESGDIIERDTTGGTIKRLADKYTTEFFTTPIQDKLINMASARCEISKSELHASLDTLKDMKYRNEVNTFLCALFQLFFNENVKFQERDIHSAVFGATSDAIFRRSNSNDPLVKIVKDTCNGWLKRGSKVYRGTTRTATRSNYKRAIYLYFVFMIMWR